MKVIRVSNISKTYGKVHAVCDLSFEVEEQTCFGFLGPNGAGKTTMMKMLYGMVAVDRDCKGKIDVFGHDPSHDELAIKYQSGVVSQDNNLDDELNVITNLMVYSKFYGLPAQVAKERIGSLLEFLELSDRTRARIRELSGGMKRRLVIARALLNNPRLLILDEPTTGLDPQVRHMIWEKLRQLRKQGTTILLTTHYMEEAFQICDTVLIMNKGRRVAEDTPVLLLEKNIERYVLEISDAQARQQIDAGRVPSGVREDHSQGVSRFYSQDIDRLRELAATLGSNHYYLRQSNLEDVFLKTTGRGLHENQ